MCSKQIINIWTIILTVLLLGCNSSPKPFTTPGHENVTPDMEKTEPTITTPTAIAEVADIQETPMQPTRASTELLPPPFKIAFISGELSDSDTDLNVVSIQGDDLKNLTDIHNIDHPQYPVWSPDGSKLAFMDWDQQGSGCILYVISSDGKNLVSLEQILGDKQVTPDCSRGSTSWSPDSQRIAFLGITSSHPYYYWDIYIASADGNSLENLTGHFIYDVNNEPIGCGGLDPEALKGCQGERAPEIPLEWSPDGNSLLFGVRDAIYMVNDSGNNLTKLTHPEVAGAYPVDSTPDGRFIIYVSENEGTIYSLAAGGAEPKLLGKGIGPVLSPNGMHIAYCGELGGIYVTDINGRNTTQVLSPQNAICSSYPYPYQWSSASNFLAIAGRLHEKGAIWVVSRDGSWKKQLVKDVSVPVPSMFSLSQ